MKKIYIVETHVGVFETWAVSAKNAIANIRCRIYGRCADSSDTMYWQAREA